MWKYTNMLMLAAPALIISDACHAAQSGVWEEDLRRCMIYKAINRGRVVIANDEGHLDIEVQRDGDGDEEADTRTYVITFDDRAPIDSTPPRNAGAGIYDHRLGTYATIAPVFSKARKMTILITAPDKPEDTITVPIGNGVKAIAFLKRCEDYWRRYHKKQR